MRVDIYLFFFLFLCSELVATGAQDHTIRIWDLSRLSTRKQEHVWPNSKFGSMSVRHWIDSLAPEDKSFCVATLGAVGNRDPHVGHTGMSVLDLPGGRVETTSGSFIFRFQSSRCWCRLGASHCAYFEWVRFC